MQIYVNHIQIHCVIHVDDRLPIFALFSIPPYAINGHVINDLVNTLFNITMDRLVNARVCMSVYTCEYFNTKLQAKYWFRSADRLCLSIVFLGPEPLSIIPAASFTIPSPSYAFYLFFLMSKRRDIASTPFHALVSYRVWRSFPVLSGSLANHRSADYMTSLQNDHVYLAMRNAAPWQ